MIKPYFNNSGYFCFGDPKRIYETDVKKEYKLKEAFICFESANDFYKDFYVYKLLTERFLKWI